MWTRQQLLHDVGIIDLPTPTKAIFLILKLLVVFYLDILKLLLLGMFSWKLTLLKQITSLGKNHLHVRSSKLPKETTISNIVITKLE